MTPAAATLPVLIGYGKEAGSILVLLQPCLLKYMRSILSHTNSGCLVTLPSTLNSTSIHPLQVNSDPPTALTDFLQGLSLFMFMERCSMCCDPARQMPAPLSGNILSVFGFICLPCMIGFSFAGISVTSMGEGVTPDHRATATVNESELLSYSTCAIRSPDSVCIALAWSIVFRGANLLPPDDLCCRHTFEKWFVMLQLLHV